MLNIYTVSFFGHRYIDNASEVEQHLDCLLHDLIVQKEYVEFLVGRDGDFDTIASAAIKRAIHSLKCYTERAVDKHPKSGRIK